MRVGAFIIARRYNYWPETFPGGVSGVDLFFVLSGYLIGGILLDNRGASGFFTTFYGRRAFRILPLYWLLLALYPDSGLPVWWYAVFGQNAGWLIAAPFPVGHPLFVTWSLAVEEQFYLVLPVLVAVLPQRWLVRVLWSCVLLAPLWRYGLCRLDSPGAFFLLPGRLDALMGGTLIACFTRGYARSRLLWAALALAAPAQELVLNQFDASYRSWLSAVALGFCATLWLNLRLPPTRLTTLRPLAWLGIGAYSIYLFHIPIVYLTGSVALAVPVTLAVAWVSWHCIDRFCPAALAIWGPRSACGGSRARSPVYPAGVRL